jgi:hypothetical protein
MHAKVTVADDTVFCGSLNLSRSGEDVRDRYERMPVPAEASGPLG